MTRALSRPLALTIALGALTLTSAAAHASSHSVGPHTKTQLKALCIDANGVFSAGPVRWDCDAQRWTIACTLSGEVCIIDLFGGGTGRPTVTVAATGASLQGSGNSGPPKQPFTPPLAGVGDTNPMNNHYGITTGGNGGGHGTVVLGGP